MEIIRTNNRISTLSAQPGTKVRSKWIKDLNIRHESIRFIEENVGRTPPDIEAKSILKDETALTDHASGSKHKQMGLHQTKKLLHFKRNSD